MLRSLLLLLTASVFALSTSACVTQRAKKAPLDLEDDDSEQKEGTKPSRSTIEGQPLPGQETKPDPAKNYIVFAHSADTLYSLDTVTNVGTTIGKVNCLDTAQNEWLIDIALDAAGTMFATTGTRLLSVDAKTASCTEIGRTSVGDDYENYPNSLSFVPKGTLDANEEALVGYAYDGADQTQSAYVRINRTTGAISFVGWLNPWDATTRYESSGDLIALSNDGNRAYLTVRPLDGGTDRLAEIDPRTGSIVRIVGDTAQTQLYGLAYWNGKAYAFSGGGGVFSLDMTSGAATAMTLNGLPSVIWHGAGVTTVAPLK